MEHRQNQAAGGGSASYARKLENSCSSLYVPGYIYVLVQIVSGRHLSPSFLGGVTFAIFGSINIWLKVNSLAM